MALAKTQMAPEGTVVSEISQRNTLCGMLHVESKEPAESRVGYAGTGVGHVPLHCASPDYQ